MTKLQEIEAFQYSYTVKNVYTNHKVEADTIGEALWKAKNELLRPQAGYRSCANNNNVFKFFTTGFGRKCNDWLVYKEYRPFTWSKYSYLDGFVREDAYPLVMYNNLGAVIHPDEIARHKLIAPVIKPWQDKWKERAARRNMKDSRRLWKAGNPDKLKYDWSVKESRDVYGDISYDNHCRFYRRIRTAQARRMAVAHCEEYGNEMVRGKRRHRNLLTSWDDISSSMWYTQESWKHHSKRAKQWRAK